MLLAFTRERHGNENAVGIQEGKVYEQKCCWHLGGKGMGTEMLLAFRRERYGNGSAVGIQEGKV